MELLSAMFHCDISAAENCLISDAYVSMGMQFAYKRNMDVGTLDPLMTDNTELIEQ